MASFHLPFSFLTCFSTKTYDALSSFVQGEVQVDIPAFQQFQCVEVERARENVDPRGDELASMSPSACGRVRGRVRVTQSCFALRDNGIPGAKVPFSSSSVTFLSDQIRSV